MEKDLRGSIGDGGEHDEPMPSRMEPRRLLQGLKKIRLSAVFDFETAVSPVQDGGHEDFESLLNGVMEWTGTDGLRRLRKTVEDDSVGGGRRSQRSFAQ